MTFPHRHANMLRSLWPAVSLSPTISATVWPPRGPPTKTVQGVVELGMCSADESPSYNITH
ncbi:hypothetical protein EYF80_045616 [Liparis tanakae]|uniref:Uncharacterized protein n=1 Tax=Liparis tanakae TaxID=230148 RepID=A0A4Z2FT30_9TELE|nr:hypothetical protein EYF80_045616 [Liparis tanakae]